MSKRRLTPAPPLLALLLAPTAPAVLRRLRVKEVAMTLATGFLTGTLVGAFAPSPSPMPFSTS